ncbi:MAG: hypothetical protein AAFR38_01015 [Planctomycetota bacterium]
MLLLRFAVRGYRRMQDSVKIPMEMSADPGTVNVICHAGDVERMKAIDTGHFEPEIFRVMLATRRPRIVEMRRGPRRTAGMIAGYSIAATAFSLAFFVPSMQRFFMPMLAMALILPTLYLVLRPTYLRFAPGRVDVFRYGLIGSEPTVESHDLRAPPLRLDLKHRQILIGGWHQTHEAPEDRDEEAERKRRRSMLAYSAGNKDPQGSLGTVGQLEKMTIIRLGYAISFRDIETAAYKACVTAEQPGPLPTDRLI